MTLPNDRRNIVVIGTSAGGVEALSTLLGHLPAELDAAILVVLHLSPSAPSQLDGVLSKRTALRVKAARDGDALQPATVFTASADRHLVLMPDGLRLTRGPKESRARPAVDVLFRSAAAAYGSRVIGVVLTGALDDGTAVLQAIKDHGGLAFVQDPDEASFASMPQSAIDQVQTDCVGTLRTLADRLVATVGMPAPGVQQAHREEERVRTEITIASKAMV